MALDLPKHLPPAYLARFSLSMKTTIKMALIRKRCRKCDIFIIKTMSQMRHRLNNTSGTEKIKLMSQMRHQVQKMVPSWCKYLDFEIGQKLEKMMGSLGRLS